MKIKLFILALICVCNFCFSQTSQSPAKINVYFFHGTHRCTGCVNAEKSAVTVLNALYKDMLDKGTITFTSVNIEEEANKPLAEKYEVAWNALLFVKSNGSEKIDLTQQAFAYGSSPDELKPIVKKTVDSMLK